MSRAVMKQQLIKPTLTLWHDLAAAAVHAVVATKPIRMVVHRWDRCSNHVIAAALGLPLRQAEIERLTPRQCQRLLVSLLAERWTRL